MPSPQSASPHLIASPYASCRKSKGPDYNMPLRNRECGGDLVISTDQALPFQRKLYLDWALATSQEDEKRPTGCKKNEFGKRSLRILFHTVTDFRQDHLTPQNFASFLVLSSTAPDRRTTQNGLYSQKGGSTTETLQRKLRN